jgi:tetratricopeptide (TPR) repeat protein
LSSAQRLKPGAKSAPPDFTAGGDIVRSIERMEQALQADPTNVDLLLRSARFCLELGRPAEATTLLTQARKLVPRQPEPIALMSEVLRQEGRHAEAIELLQQAIERDAGAAVLWHACAKAMVDLHDHESAMTFFGEALRLAPDLHACRMARAALMVQLDRLADAAADLEILRKALPQDAGVLAKWGDVKAMTGDRETARIAYTAALPLAQNRRAVEDRFERLALSEIAMDLPRQEAAAPAAGGAARRLAIVFFHVDTPQTHTPFDKPDYHALLAASIAVARRRSPAASIVVLSDMRTRFKDTLGADRIVRRQLDPSQVMYERMRSQREFLAAQTDGEATLFLDTDAIVSRDLLPAFDGSFDVGLTWRHDPFDAPFNGGVIFCRNNAATLRFFDHLLAAYHMLEGTTAVRARFEGGIRRWWGDQLAMTATIGHDTFVRRKSDRLAIDGTVVRLLPERTHNFVMSRATPLSAPERENAWLVHFKGARKDDFWRYAEHVLGPQAPALVAARAPAPAEPRFATYDLGVAPITYDVAWFLALAKNRGVTHIDIVPGAHHGFRDDAWCQKADTDEKNFRLWNIILPACQLAGMTVAMHRDRAHAAATVYKMRPLIDEGLKGDVFKATGHARRWVAQWLAARGLQRPVVINLRESQFPARNSNMAAWRRFAESTNAVVIPDTDGATAFGHVFDGLSMDRRLALYEAAEVVMGANNGPLALCWLSRSVPYLTFKMVADHPACTPEFFQRQGLPVGAQFPWAGPLQRVVWADDDYATIRAAYDVFLAAAGKT